MPSFLTGIGAKLIGAAVVLALVAGAYLRYEQVLAERNQYQADYQSAETALDQAKQVNDQDAAEIAKIKTDYQKAQAAQAVAEAAAQARAVQLTQIESEVDNAPASQRGRVPPVLAHVYDELLQRAPAGGNAH